MREVFDSDKVITPAAYLLFYRRRSDKPLGGPHYERILTTTERTPEDSAEETASSSRGSSPNWAGEGGPSDDSSIPVTVNGGTYRKSSGGGANGFRMYGSNVGGVGNAVLWETPLNSNTTTVVEDDQPPAYSVVQADESDESGMEMTLLPDLIGPVPEVGFRFGGHTDLKNELIADMNEADADTDMNGGGVVIPKAEEDSEPAEIRVDDEDTITPSADDNDREAIL